MAKFKTKCCGEMYWAKGIIEEDGALNELSNKYERSITIRYPKDSKQAKDMIAELEQIWAEYRSSRKIKQAQPKTWGYKDVTDKDGNPTNEIEFRFKTNAKFPDGKANYIKIYNAKGEDLTQAFIDDGIKIGNGTKGIIHGEAGIYEYAKQHGITLYLKAIQITKLVKYEDDIKPDDLSDQGEDIDTNGVSAISGDESVPM